MLTILKNFSEEIEVEKVFDFLIKKNQRISA